MFQVIILALNYERDLGYKEIKAYTFFIQVLYLLCNGYYNHFVYLTIIQIKLN